MSNSGAVKTASVGSRPVSDTLELLEKTAASGSSPDVAFKLIKEASVALRTAVTEIARKNEELETMRKVSSIRGRVDEMLHDGVITVYDVEEKVAELMAAEDFAPSYRGSSLEKIAEDAPTHKRGIFDGVLGQL